MQLTILSLLSLTVSSMSNSVFSGLGKRLESYQVNHQTCNKGDKVEIDASEILSAFQKKNKPNIPAQPNKQISPVTYQNTDPPMPSLTKLVTTKNTEPETYKQMEAAKPKPVQKTKAKTVEKAKAKSMKKSDSKKKSDPKLKSDSKKNNDPKSQPATKKQSSYNTLSSWASQCLGRHNEYRRMLICSDGTKVDELVWSPKLAEKAQIWANKLVQESKQNGNSIGLRHSTEMNFGYGENLYSTQNGDMGCGAVDAWFNEWPLYHNEVIPNGDFMGYGHYTQVSLDQ